MKNDYPSIVGNSHSRGKELPVAKQMIGKAAPVLKDRFLQLFLLDSLYFTQPFYFRHNRRLFSDVNRLISAMVERFHTKIANRPIHTGMIQAYQTSGAFVRFNPRWHAIAVEGGFDEAGRFVHIPLGNLKRISEYFRRVIIKFFLKKKLISANMATSLINWKHSGFSFNFSLGIGSHSDNARKALSHAISRTPLPLTKMSIQENGEATVIFYTSDKEFFQSKTETFSLSRFFLEVTQHIPPRGAQYIRRYCFMPPGRRESGWTCIMWSGSPLWDGKPCACRLLSRCDPARKKRHVRFQPRKTSAPGPGSLLKCTRSIR